MVYCIVRNCQAEIIRKRKGSATVPSVSSRSFHHLPPDEHGRRLWLYRIGREDLLWDANLHSLKICSAHFSAEMWTRGRRRLTQCAIPNCNIGVSDSDSDDVIIQSSESNDNSVIWVQNDCTENETSQQGSIQDLDFEIQDQYLKTETSDVIDESAISATNATVSFLDDPTEDQDVIERKDESKETDEAEETALIENAEKDMSYSTLQKKSAKAKILDPITPLTQLLLPTKKEKVKREKKKRKKLLSASLLTIQNAINDFINYDKSAEKSLNIFAAYLDNELKALDRQTLAKVKFQINQILYEASSGTYKNVIIKTVRVPEQSAMTKSTTSPAVGGLPALQPSPILPKFSSIKSPNLAVQRNTTPIKVYMLPRPVDLQQQRLYTTPLQPPTSSDTYTKKCL